MALKRKDKKYAPHVHLKRAFPLNFVSDITGAFASVALALLFPVIIDTVVKLPTKDFGKYYWKLIKVRKSSERTNGLKLHEIDAFDS